MSHYGIKLHIHVDFEIIQCIQNGTLFKKNSTILHFYLNVLKYLVHKIIKLHISLNYLSHFAS